MKLTYEFVTGERLELEVPEGIGEVSIVIDRKIQNSDHTETRRHNSMQAMLDNGVQLADGSCDILAEVLVAATNEAIHKALADLLPQQRDLIQKVYFEEMSLAQLARDEGVGESAIRDRLQRIYKKLKNSLAETLRIGVFPGYL